MGRPPTLGAVNAAFIINFAATTVFSRLFRSVGEYGGQSLQVILAIVRPPEYEKAFSGQLSAMQSNSISLTDRWNEDVSRMNIEHRTSNIE
jgi:hypothetical protein